jgi:hypothetical protein
MNTFVRACCTASFFCLQFLFFRVAAREITFCGEPIPVHNDAVAQKLRQVIRQQIPYANLPALRRDAKKYFPLIEYCLKASGMPADLKYIPIVESGFKNLTSTAGAQGFWQLMAPTAREWGLQVSAYRDERNDLYKATLAALRELARTYKAIQRDHKVSSWVLTAAAYNFGIGRLYSQIKTQGNNYFTMKLNAETAVYVYKLIAIKELFEYPDRYLPPWDDPLFPAPALLTGEPRTVPDSTPALGPLEGVRNAYGPQAALTPQGDISVAREAVLVGAHLNQSYRSFQDGDSLTLVLQEDLPTAQGGIKKGERIRGKGWIVKDRVWIDLGLPGHEVLVYDGNGYRGLAAARLQEGAQVILRIRR